MTTRNQISSSQKLQIFKQETEPSLADSTSVKGAQIKNHMQIKFECFGKKFKLVTHSNNLDEGVLKEIR